MLVLRTFSKAHGLAGLRVAYAMGQPENLKALSRVRSTFSISSAAQAGALAAIDDTDHVAQAVKNNSAGATQLRGELIAMGYSIPETWGNFIYCELGEDARAFAQKMDAQGVSIRPLGPWGAPTAIRVTIGTPEQNEIFLAAFRKIAKPA